MKQPTLLCVVAHPDDETFGAAGILIHAIAAGMKAVTICATRGEAGEIMERSNATPETLAAVRELEYRRAGQIMGVSESILLDYRDSGMPGTPENEDSAAFINQSREQVIDDIARVMDSVRPEIVLTAEPGGGYGHPDHIFASQCAIAAFERARENESNSGWAPQKLYYFTFPRSQMRKFFDEMKRSDPESGLAQLDPDEFGTPDEEITLTLDVSPHIDQIQEAFAAHLSQLSPLERVSDELSNEFIGQASLVRVFPEPDASSFEQDILDGLG